MCGTIDDGVKTRQHELILFNVTYENIKISYSFMVKYQTKPQNRKSYQVQYEY